MLLAHLHLASCQKMKSWRPHASRLGAVCCHDMLPLQLLSVADKPASEPQRCVSADMFHSLPAVTAHASHKML